MPNIDDMRAAGVSEEEITDAITGLIAKATMRDGVTVHDLTLAYGVTRVRANQIAARAHKRLGLGIRTAHGWRFKPEDVEVMRPKRRPAKPEEVAA